ncbi:MAG: type II secretion system F family protein, partial [Betaproteobacteria bacterium]|nr:type II secretion system F family protein [Betaproteobacteria bacterium]
QYKAVDKTGQPARGSLEAANEVDLELRLRRMGLDLITFREIEKTASGFGGGGSVTRRDLITFCFDMEQISRSGIPILEGIRDLRDSIENPRFREILTTLTEDMEGGRILSQSMSQHPQVFDKVFVSLIRAGEQAGRLTDIFTSLANTLKWQDELASQTKRLLMYPAFVLVVVSAVMIFMLAYLVPQIVTLLKAMGVALPIQTKVLIFASNFVVNYWPFVFGIPTVLVIALVAVVKRSQKAQYLWDYTKLRLPVIGPILQKIIMSRFTNLFALMYQSGITILDAIKTSEDIVGNRVIADGLMRAGQQINSGESLTETFQNLGVFPPLVIRMLRVGEATGALDTALMNVTYFYNRDVKDAVDKGMAMIGPALTVFMGGMMMFILWAVLGPVYDILGKVKT